MDLPNVRSLTAPGVWACLTRTGIAKARDALRAIGGSVPTLTQSQVNDLEPYVSASAHGHDYAERVHKLGASFLNRLIMLKRLADAIEREEAPLATFKAPSVGQVGREPNCPWTPQDDAMLLLGVYKHGAPPHDLPTSLLQGHPSAAP